MIGKYARGKICVFIDAANLESAVKDAGWWIDYEKLKNYLRSEANLVQIRFYCVRHDSENQNRFFAFLKKRGYRLVTKPLKKIAVYDQGDCSHLRKANFDVEIALDAYMAKEDYDTLVLFSGDSDFKYLVEALRKGSKRVIVVSAKYHISKELIETADKYIDIKKLRPFIERENR